MVSVRRRRSVGIGGRARRAFTLVELVLVTVLIGIFAGLAVPRYVNFIAHQQVDAAARRVAVDLAFAQRQAKFSSASRTIRFEVSKNSYRLLGVTDPNHPAREYAVALGDEPYLATLVSADFGGLSDLTFDGYGVPGQSGSVVVRFGDHQRTVSVDAGDVTLRPRR